MPMLWLLQKYVKTKQTKKVLPVCLSFVFVFHISCYHFVICQHSFMSVGDQIKLLHFSWFMPLFNSQKEFSTYMTTSPLYLLTILTWPVPIFFFNSFDILFFHTYLQSLETKIRKTMIIQQEINDLSICNICNSQFG